MKKRILPVLMGAALLAGVMLAGCSGASDVTVSVESVGMITGTAPLVLPDRFAGVVVAGDTAEIKKDSEMTIAEQKVDVGDVVEEGQVLFTYDTESIQLTLEKLKLELEQLKNTISTNKTQINQLEEEKKSVGSSAQLEYTLQIQTLQTQIKETEYAVIAKQKEIDHTGKALENSSVTAPIAGCVQSINLNDATDENGNLKPFMVIVETSAFRVKGEINELNASALMEGTPVLLRSRMDSSITWKGTILSIDWENPVTGGDSGIYFDGAADETTTSSKYPFYVELESNEGMMLGQHLYIEPDIGQAEEPEGLELPAFYLCDADSEPYVWAANDKDKLEKRAVTLGGYNEEMDTYLVLEGLTPEDYIAMPDDTCREGAAVVRYSEENFDTEGLIEDNMDLTEDMDMEPDAVYGEDEAPMPEDETAVEEDPDLTGTDAGGTDTAGVVG